MIVVLMGVSGCGKTTVGKLLAESLSWPFYDADDFHPPANVERMHAGVPLTDEDRWPWLDRLNQLLRELEGKGHSGILACSALRERYRERLARGCKDLRWVHLKGSFELIYSRMQQRKGHYMPASLLQSQFDTLEPPAYGTVIDIADAPEVLAARIRQCVATDRPGSTEQVVQ